MELSRASSAGPGGSSSSVKELRVDTFRLPEYLGTVRDLWSSDKPAKTTVIHIQDAHCNYNAQHRIAEIVRYLNKEFGVSTLNLEGGAREYDLSVFTRITDKPLREKVADYFVKEGIVSGPEYLAANSPGTYALWGLEDPKLYMENLGAYRDMYKHKDEIDAGIKAINFALSNLKAKIYSKELFEFDSRYTSYKAGNLQFRDYLEYLIALAPKRSVTLVRFPNITLLVRSFDAEKGIDFKTANTERETLVDALRKDLSQNDFEKLVTKTVEYKAERISQKDFYTYLIGTARAAGVDLAGYPELGKYIAYVSIYDSIDRSKIMEEIASLEDAIKTSLYRNDTEKELSILSKDLALLKNIFNISITKDDYRYYLANVREFDTLNFVRFIDRYAPRYQIDAKLNGTISNLDAYRRGIEQFYEYSFKRDDAFVKNMRGQVAIMITGGFHTENLCDLFKKNGISYVSITPNFKMEEGYQCPYFRLLAGKPCKAAENLNSVLARSLAIASILTDLGYDVYGRDGRVAFELLAQWRTAAERGKGLMVNTGPRGGIDKDGNVATVTPANENEFEIGRVDYIASDVQAILRVMPTEVNRPALDLLSILIYEAQLRAGGRAAPNAALESLVLEHSAKLAPLSLDLRGTIGALAMAGMGGAAAPVLVEEAAEEEGIEPEPSEEEAEAVKMTPEELRARLQEGNGEVVDTIAEQIGDLAGSPDDAVALLSDLEQVVENAGMTRNESILTWISILATVLMMNEGLKAPILKTIQKSLAVHMPQAQAMAAITPRAGFLSGTQDQALSLLSDLSLLTRMQPEFSAIYGEEMAKLFDGVFSEGMIDALADGMKDDDKNIRIQLNIRMMSNAGVLNRLGQRNIGGAHLVYDILRPDIDAKGAEDEEGMITQEEKAELLQIAVRTLLRSAEGAAGAEQTTAKNLLKTIHERLNPAQGNAPTLLEAALSELKGSIMDAVVGGEQEISDADLIAMIKNNNRGPFEKRVEFLMKEFTGSENEERKDRALAALIDIGELFAYRNNEDLQALIMDDLSACVALLTEAVKGAVPGMTDLQKIYAAQRLVKIASSKWLAQDHNVKGAEAAIRDTIIPAFDDVLAGGEQLDAWKTIARGLITDRNKDVLAMVKRLALGDTKSKYAAIDILQDLENLYKGPFDADVKEVSDAIRGSLEKLLAPDLTAGLHVVMRYANNERHPQAVQLLRDFIDGKYPTQDEWVKVHVIDTLVAHCMREQDPDLAGWLIRGFIARSYGKEHPAYALVQREDLGKGTYTDILSRLYNDKGLPSAVRVYIFGLLPKHPLGKADFDLMTEWLKTFRGKTADALLAGDPLTVNETVKTYYVAILAALIEHHPTDIPVEETEKDGLISDIMTDTRFVEYVAGVANSGFAIGKNIIPYSDSAKTHLFGTFAHELGHRIFSWHARAHPETGDMRMFNNGELHFASLSEFMADVSAYAFFESQGWYEEKKAERDHYMKSLEDVLAAVRICPDNPLAISKECHEAARASLEQLFKSRFEQSPTFFMGIMETALIFCRNRGGLQTGNELEQVVNELRQKKLDLPAIELQQEKSAVTVAVWLAARDMITLDDGRAAPDDAVIEKGADGSVRVMQGGNILLPLQTGPEKEKGALVNELLGAIRKTDSATPAQVALAGAIAAVIANQVDHIVPVMAYGRAFFAFDEAARTVYLNEELLGDATGLFYMFGRVYFEQDPYALPTANLEGRRVTVDPATYLLGCRGELRMALDKARAASDRVDFSLAKTRNMDEFRKALKAEYDIDPTAYELALIELNYGRGEDVMEGLLGRLFGPEKRLALARELGALRETGVDRGGAPLGMLLSLKDAVENKNASIELLKNIRASAPDPDMDLEDVYNRYLAPLTRQYLDAINVRDGVEKRDKERELVYEMVRGIREDMCREDFGSEERGIAAAQSALSAALKARGVQFDEKRMAGAFAFARGALCERIRKDGSLFYLHSIRTALIYAERAETPTEETVLAAILHDSMDRGVAAPGDIYFTRNHFKDLAGKVKALSPALDERIRQRQGEVADSYINRLRKDGLYGIFLAEKIQNIDDGAALFRERPDDERRYVEAKLNPAAVAAYLRVPGESAIKAVFFEKYMGLMAAMGETLPFGDVSRAVADMGDQDREKLQAIATRWGRIDIIVNDVCSLFKLDKAALSAIRRGQLYILGEMIYNAQLWAGANRGPVDAKGLLAAIEQREGLDGLGLDLRGTIGALAMAGMGGAAAALKLPVEKGAARGKLTLLEKPQMKGKGTADAELKAKERLGKKINIEKFDKAFEGVVDVIGYGAFVRMLEAAEKSGSWHESFDGKDLLQTATWFAAEDLVASYPSLIRMVENISGIKTGVKNVTYLLKTVLPEMRKLFKKDASGKDPFGAYMPVLAELFTRAYREEVSGALVIGLPLVAKKLITDDRSLREVGNDLIDMYKRAGGQAYNMFEEGLFLVAGIIVDRHLLREIGSDLVRIYTVDSETRSVFSFALPYIKGQIKDKKSYDEIITGLTALGWPVAQHLALAVSEDAELGRHLPALIRLGVAVGVENAKALYDHAIPAVKGLVSKQYPFRRLLADLERLAAASGDEAGYVFEYGIPALHKAFGNDLPGLWQEFLGIGVAAGPHAGHVFRHGLPAFRYLVKKGYSFRDLGADLSRMAGDMPEEGRLYVFMYGFPDVTHLVKDRASLNATGKALIALGNKAGWENARILYQFAIQPLKGLVTTTYPFEKLVDDLARLTVASGAGAEFTLRYGIAELKSAFRDTFPAYWQECVRIGIAAGRNAEYLFQSGLPTFRYLIKDDYPLGRLGDDLVRLADAVPAESVEGLFMEGLPAASALVNDSASLALVGEGLAALGKSIGWKGVAALFHGAGLGDLLKGRPERLDDLVQIAERVPHFFQLISPGGLLYDNRNLLLADVLSSDDPLEQARKSIKIFKEKRPYHDQLFEFTLMRLSKELEDAHTEYPITEVPPADGAEPVPLQDLLEEHERLVRADPAVVTPLRQMLVPELREEIIERLAKKKAGAIPFAAFTFEWKKIIYKDYLRRSIGQSRASSAKEFADRMNRGLAKDPLRVVPGTYIHGAPFDAMGSILLNGNLPGESLGEQSQIDSFPFQVDFSCLTSAHLADNVTLAEQILNSISVSYGRKGSLGEAGQMWYFYRRTPDRSTWERGKAYATSESGMHTLVLGGMPSTEISAIVLRDPSATLDGAKTAICENGFYIPVYDMEGKLLFSYDEYVEVRERLNLKVPVETVNPSEFEVADARQKGSNPGYEIQWGDGRYYIKFTHSGSADQLWCEYLSERIYGLLGIPVPETKMLKINGQYCHASKMLPPAERELDRTEDLRRGFLADALLANWDVPLAFNQNTFAAADGRAYRIDSGGALMFRARGERKDAQAWASGREARVNELEEMDALPADDRQVAPGTRQAYKGITEGQIIDQARLLNEALTDEAIDGLVESVRLEREERKALKATLIHRRDYILKWVADKYLDHDKGRLAVEPAAVPAPIKDTPMGELFEWMARPGPFAERMRSLYEGESPERALGPVAALRGVGQGAFHKGFDAGEHTLRVAKEMDALVAREAGMTPQRRRDLRILVLFHDIGKEGDANTTTQAGHEERSEKKFREFMEEMRILSPDMERLAFLIGIHKELGDIAIGASRLGAEGLARRLLEYGEAGALRDLDDFYLLTQADIRSIPGRASEYSEYSPAVAGNLESAYTAVRGIIADRLAPKKAPRKARGGTAAALEAAGLGTGTIPLMMRAYTALGGTEATYKKWVGPILEEILFTALPLLFWNSNLRIIAPLATLLFVALHGVAINRSAGRLGLQRVAIAPAPKILGAASLIVQAAAWLAGLQMSWPVIAILYVAAVAGHMYVNRKDVAGSSGQFRTAFRVAAVTMMVAFASFTIGSTPTVGQVLPAPAVQVQQQVRQAEATEKDFREFEQLEKVTAASRSLFQLWPALSPAHAATHAGTNAGHAASGLVIVSPAETTRKALERVYAEAIQAYEDAKKIEPLTDIDVTDIDAMKAMKAMEAMNDALNKSLHDLQNLLPGAEKTLGANDETVIKSDKLFKKLIEQWKFLKGMVPAGKYITDKTISATVESLKKFGGDAFVGVAEKLLREMQDKGVTMKLESKADIIEYFSQGSPVAFSYKLNPNNGDIIFDEYALIVLNNLATRADGGEEDAQKALAEVAEHVLSGYVHEAWHSVFRADPAAFNKICEKLLKEDTPLFIEMAKYLLLIVGYPEQLNLEGAGIDLKERSAMAIKAESGSPADNADARAFLEKTARSVAASSAARIVAEELLAGHDIHDVTSNRRIFSDSIKHYESTREKLRGMLITDPAMAWLIKMPVTLITDQAAIGAIIGIINTAEPSAPGVLPKGNLAFLRTLLVDWLGLNKTVAEDAVIPFIEEVAMGSLLYIMPGVAGLVSYVVARAAFTFAHAVQNIRAPPELGRPYTLGEKLGILWKDRELLKRQIALPVFYSLAGVLLAAPLTFITPWLGADVIASLTVGVTFFFHALGNLSVTVFGLGLQKGVLGEEEEPAMPAALSRGVNAIGKFEEVRPVRIGARGRLTGLIRRLDGKREVDFSVAGHERISEQRAQRLIDKVEQLCRFLPENSSERIVLKSVLARFRSDLPGKTIFIMNEGAKGFFGMVKEDFLILDENILDNPLTFLHQILMDMKDWRSDGTGRSVAEKLEDILDGDAIRFIEKHEAKYAATGKSGFFEDNKIHYIIRAFTGQVFSDLDRELKDQIRTAERDLAEREKYERILTDTDRDTRALSLLERRPSQVQADDLAMLAGILDEQNPLGGLVNGMIQKGDTIVAFQVPGIARDSSSFGIKTINDTLSPEIGTRLIAERRKLILEQMIAHGFIESARQRIYTTYKDDVFLIKRPLTPKDISALYAIVLYVKKTMYSVKMKDYLTAANLSFTEGAAFFEFNFGLSKVTEDEPAARFMADINAHQAVQMFQAGLEPIFTMQSYTEMLDSLWAVRDKLVQATTDADTGISPLFEKEVRREASGEERTHYFMRPDMAKVLRSRTPWGELDPAQKPKFANDIVIYESARAYYSMLNMQDYMKKWQRDFPQAEERALRMNDLRDRLESLAKDPSRVGADGQIVLTEKERALLDSAKRYITEEPKMPSLTSSVAFHARAPPMANPVYITMDIKGMGIMNVRAFEEELQNIREALKRNDMKAVEEMWRSAADGVTRDLLETNEMVVDYIAETLGIEPSRIYVLMGGDEFNVVFDKDVPTQDLVNLLHKIKARAKLPFRIAATKAARSFRQQFIDRTDVRPRYLAHAKAIVNLEEAVTGLKALEVQDVHDVVAVQAESDLWRVYDRDFMDVMLGIGPGDMAAEVKPSVVPVVPGRALYGFALGDLALFAAYNGVPAFIVTGTIAIILLAYLWRTRLAAQVVLAPAGATLGIIAPPVTAAPLAPPVARIPSEPSVPATAAVPSAVAAVPADALTVPVNGKRVAARELTDNQLKYFETYLSKNLERLRRVGGDLTRIRATDDDLVKVRTVIADRKEIAEVRKRVGAELSAVIDTLVKARKLDDPAVLEGEAIKTYADARVVKKAERIASFSLADLKKLLEKCRKNETDARENNDTVSMRRDPFDIYMHELAIAIKETGTVRRINAIMNTFPNIGSLYFAKNTDPDYAVKFLNSIEKSDVADLELMDAALRPDKLSDIREKISKRLGKTYTDANKLYWETKAVLKEDPSGYQGDFLMEQFYPDDVPVWRGIEDTADGRKASEFAGLPGPDGIRSYWGLCSRNVAMLYVGQMYEAGSAALVRTTVGALRENGILMGDPGNLVNKAMLVHYDPVSKVPIDEIVTYETEAAKSPRREFLKQVAAGVVAVGIPDMSEAVMKGAAMPQVTASAESILPYVGHLGASMDDINDAIALWNNDNDTDYQALAVEAYGLLEGSEPEGNKVMWDGKNKRWWSLKTDTIMPVLFMPGLRIAEQGWNSDSFALAMRELGILVVDASVFDGVALKADREGRARSLAHKIAHEGQHVLNFRANPNMSGLEEEALTYEATAKAVKAADPKDVGSFKAQDAVAKAFRALVDNKADIEERYGAPKGAFSQMYYNDVQLSDQTSKEKDPAKKIWLVGIQVTYRGNEDMVWVDVNVVDKTGTAKPKILQPGDLQMKMSMAPASQYAPMVMGGTALMRIAGLSPSSDIAVAALTPEQMAAGAAAAVAVGALKDASKEPAKTMTRREALAGMLKGAAGVAVAGAVLSAPKAEAARLKAPLPVPSAIQQAGLPVRLPKVPGTIVDDVVASLWYVKGADGKPLISAQKVRAAVKLSNSDDYRKFASGAYDRLASVKELRHFGYDRFPILFLEDYPQTDACAITELELIIVSGKDFPATDLASAGKQRVLSYMAAHEGRHVINGNQPGAAGVFGRLEDEYSAVRSATQAVVALETAADVKLFNNRREYAFRMLLTPENKKAICGLFDASVEAFDKDVYYENIVYNADSDVFGITLKYWNGTENVLKRIWISTTDLDNKETDILTDKDVQMQLSQAEWLEAFVITAASILPTSKPLVAAPVAPQEAVAPAPAITPPAVVVPAAPAMEPFSKERVIADATALWERKRDIARIEEADIQVIVVKDEFKNLRLSGIQEVTDAQLSQITERKVDKGRDSRVKYVDNIKDAKKYATAPGRDWHNTFIFVESRIAAKDEAGYNDLKERAFIQNLVIPDGSICSITPLGFLLQGLKLHDVFTKVRNKVEREKIELKPLAEIILINKRDEVTEKNVKTLIKEMLDPFLSELIEARAATGDITEALRKTSGASYLTLILPLVKPQDWGEVTRYFQSMEQIYKSL